MKTLIFATHNSNKVKEIQELVENKFKVISLSEINFFEEIVESENSLEGNALLKARTINKLTSENCFADDTGLEVEILDNEPGVLSARYAGHECDAKKNIAKLLEKLANKNNRNAKFRTVIAMIFENKEYLFEGEVKGVITKSQKGENGFGYDPIFIPNGYYHTFAQMTLVDKNKISHRSIAFNKMIEFLKSIK